MILDIISDLTIQDSGLYTCQAKSRSGQAVWSASLEVADPNLDPSVTFNSMPYLSQFPASPSKPQMVNATATTITLSWDKPHRIGGSALQGYQVCYICNTTLLLHSAPNREFFFREIECTRFWHTQKFVKLNYSSISQVFFLSQQNYNGKYS